MFYSNHAFEHATSTGGFITYALTQANSKIWLTEHMPMDCLDAPDFLPAGSTKLAECKHAYPVTTIASRA